MSLDLAGKDYFTQEEAAHYCGVDLERFVIVCGAYGFVGQRYLKADLRAAIEEAFQNPVAHRQRILAYRPAGYTLAKLQRTPHWADRKAIAEVYAAARRRTAETGAPHHVDHIIPLQGALVSGLHVHTNLQILLGTENSRKRNRFDV